MAEPILTLTEAATQRLKSARDADQATDIALRVRVHEDGAAFRYEFELVPENTKGPGDAVVDAEGILIYIDEESVPRLRGATLDYTDDVTGGGLKFENPNKTRLSQDASGGRVQDLLDSRINPRVKDHGGPVTLIDVQEGRVFLELGGGCQGSGMVDVTLRQGIEVMLREEIPEITEVLDTTDHAAGDNPYYQPSKES
ncbi:MAG: iron-sulfur cluster assembly accessory protein [Deltaproteobacteria bacterium]|nr:iron-sulfur cluster assembly accessory protein [Deltaproteobacteria bacterium]